MQMQTIPFKTSDVSTSVTVWSRQVSAFILKLHFQSDTSIKQLETMNYFSFTVNSRNEVVTLPPWLQLQSQFIIR